MKTDAGIVSHAERHMYLGGRLGKESKHLAFIQGDGGEIVELLQEA